MAPTDTPPVPAALNVRLETNSRFDPLIQKVAKEQGVDVTLVRAVIQVESGFEPRARSSSGAVGLMQLMPSTARQYGVTPRRLYDPRANMEAGIKHLKSLMDHLPLHLALAAYNAGEGAVQRFRGVPPYPETQTSRRSWRCSSNNTCIPQGPSESDPPRSDLSALIRV